MPRQGLAGYLEFDGLDAHPAAWKGSAAYKLLNETKLGALIEDIVSQVVVQSQSQIQPADVIGGFKAAARQGFAVGIWGKEPEDLHHVVVFRGGGRGELRRLYESWPGHLAVRERRAADEKLAGDAGQKAGRMIEGLDGSFWWFEGDDLVFTSQPNPIIAVLDGKEPNAVDHRLRATLWKGEQGFQPVAIGFVDFAGLPKLSPPSVQLGLDGVRRLEFVLGFERDATRTVLRAIAPAPRRGVLALLDQPSFDANSLPPIPAGVHGFMVLSVDLPTTYDRIVELWSRTAAPGGGGPDVAAMIEDQVRQQFGFDLRKDLIAGLGPSFTFSMQDPAGGAKGSRAAAVINRLGGATITAQVRDEAALSRAIDPVMKHANRLLEGMAGPPGGGPGGAGLAFRKEGSGRPTYVLDFPQGMLPPPFSTLFRPTVILGREQLVVGASTAAAGRARGSLSRKPTADGSRTTPSPR